MAYFRECKEVIVDWYYTEEDGERYGRISCDNENVGSILYHEPDKEDGKHYVDIYHNDGDVVRHFNVNSITFMKGESQ